MFTPSALIYEHSPPLSEGKRGTSHWYAPLAGLIVAVLIVGTGIQLAEAAHSNINCTTTVATYVGQTIQCTASLTRPSGGTPQTTDSGATHVQVGMVAEGPLTIIGVSGHPLINDCLLNYPPSGGHSASCFNFNHAASAPAPYNNLPYNTPIPLTFIVHVDSCGTTARVGTTTANVYGVNSPFDFVEIHLPACPTTPPSPLPQCRDHVDNDHDARTDYPSDPGCTDANDNNEGDEYKQQCRDGRDNDGDGRVDYPDDPGCRDAYDDSEQDQPQCFDGRDNDGDRRTDFPSDPGCSSREDNNEGDEYRQQCHDGRDNDGDGWTDYPNDPGCTDFYDDSEQDQPQCRDGRDNDHDGKTDYPSDPGCTSGDDNNESDEYRQQCRDGRDNDGDGRTDFPSDPGCRDTYDDNEQDQPQCNDGHDNDGDGRTDFPSDIGCTSTSDNDESDEEMPACRDGRDNDGDGKTDYPEDPGCTSPNDNSERGEQFSECNDGRDNDYDGYTDYPSDPGCSSATDNSERETHMPRCSDGRDNDGDGLIDFPNDPGCSSRTDDDEYNQQQSPACSDGRDNDGDGLIDMQDPGCTSANDNDERNEQTVPECRDGRDNDYDGYTDFPNDPGCSSRDDTDESNTDSCPASASRYATTVVQHSGVGFDSSSPPESRTASTALGAPDGHAVNFDGSPGFVIFSFSNAITRFDTVRIHLVDFSTVSSGGGAENESFTVLMSSDGTNFVSAGSRSPTADRRGQRDTFDFAVPSSLTGTVRLVKIINNRILANNPFDGPDIDAVELMNIFCTETPQCSDGRDNDSDGYTDYPSDPGCSSRDDNSEANPQSTPECRDGRDNDYDGFTDFPNDPGCSSRDDNSEHGEATPRCSDGRDNDGDGLIDFPNDPGCSSRTDDDEYNDQYVPQCRDGRDNDGDGYTDYPNDPGCTSSDDNSEHNEHVPACRDGKDNDRDGKVDFPNDPGCSSANDNDEYNPLPPTGCADITARVNFTDVRNRQRGNVQGVVFLGDGSRRQSGEPFLLTNGTTPIIDQATNPDVPGLAIQRENGFLRLTLYGEHHQSNGWDEILYGNLELNGARITGFSFDPKHLYEKQGDRRYGTFRRPNGTVGHNDEFVGNIGARIAQFFTGVGSDQDVVIVRYQMNQVCSTGFTKSSVPDEDTIDMLDASESSESLERLDDAPMNDDGTFWEDNSGSSNDNQGNTWDGTTKEDIWQMLNGTSSSSSSFTEQTVENDNEDAASYETQGGAESQEAPETSSEQSTSSDDTEDVEDDSYNGTQAEAADHQSAPPENPTSSGADNDVQSRVLDLLKN